MILNTKTILETIISDKSKNPNPLVLKEQQKIQESIEKEDKLQAQVAIILKDPYYRQFQESAIPKQAETPEDETPAQRDERIKKELLEKQLKNQSKNTAINAGINVFGKQVFDTGINLAGKGISALGRATGYWG